MNAFVDYYEIMELEPSANAETIESQFFELGQKLHPKVPVTGDQEKFELLTEAFQILRTSESRKEYDSLYSQYNSESSSSENEIDDSDAQLENMDLVKEADDRILLMKLYYERRRTSPKNPGMAGGSLEGAMNCSPTMLEFHLWYCLQKGWLFREEGGQLSISAEGVDHVESGLQQRA